MKSQDKLRHWIKEQLATHGRGVCVRLAEFLNFTPAQINRMLNTDASKQTRNIQADEWLKILLFLGVEETNPNLPHAMMEKGKPIIIPPIRPALRPMDHAILMKIFDSAKPEQQAALAALMRIYNNAKSKQREAIVNLIRALAETYDIPH